MLNLESVKQSFSDFHVALVGVTRDAWLYNRRPLIIVILLAIIIGLVPYAVHGTEALLINHLVKVFNLKSFDAALIILTGLLLVAYVARFVSNSAFEMQRKLFWMDRCQRYDFQFSTKLAELDVATHESPDFQDKVTLLKEEGASIGVANFLDSLMWNLQNLTGVIAASAIVIVVDWRFFVIMLIANLPKFYSEVKYGRRMWKLS
jgi:ABC-type multidrug transport system fused ATPase/permease subunit